MRLKDHWLYQIKNDIKENSIIQFRNALVFGIKFDSKVNQFHNVFVLEQNLRSIKVGLPIKRQVN